MLAWGNKSREEKVRSGAGKFVTWEDHIYHASDVQ